MSAPIDDFSWWELLGYHAANDAYSYDNRLPVYIGGKKTTPTAYMKSFQSTPDERADILVRELKGTMRYRSDLSTDSVAVWTFKSRTKDSDDVLVLGFRGTDNVDPARFMNWIPEGYKQALADKMRTKYVGIKGLDNAIAKIGTGKFKALARAMGLKDTEAETCGNFCDSSCAADSIEGLLGSVTNDFCTFQKLRDPPSTRKPDNSPYWDIYRYDVDPEDVARIRSWPAEMALQGGVNAGHNNCDCVADRYITNGSIDAYVPSRFAFGDDIRNDAKHKATAQWAHKIIAKMPSYSSIVFAGHSLGGSLAFNAYSIALWLLGRSRTCYYVGFNPGTLRNFDNVAKHLKAYDPYWEYRAVVHRNSGDVVSMVGSSYVPIVTHTDSRLPKRIPSAARYVHGITTMNCSNSGADKTNFPERPRRSVSRTAVLKKRRSGSKRRSSGSKTRK